MDLTYQSSPRPEWRRQASDWLARGLYEVSQILATRQAPGSLVDALGVLGELLELWGATLTLVDSLGSVVDEFSSWRLGSTPALTACVREVVHRVVRDRMPVIAENAWVELTGQPDVAATWRETDVDASLVGVPFREQDRTLGALVIVRQHSAGDQAAFQFDADVRLLTSVARSMALAWQAAGVVTSARTDEVVGEPVADSGAALCWRAALQKALTAAKTNATVLLRGETGVGKTVLARLVHEASKRRERPFIAINCAALSESLLESELFGHERGAFTGAVSQRKGRFELADTGTLFLDEIGEISASFQAKLLRVLQEGELERIGGTATLKVDVRLIAATHRNLEAAVRRGTFRADLYYRLCVVPVRVPPLRERPEDIALLAHTFLTRFNAENGTHRVLDQSALRALLTHPFPGNVRELENAIRRAATLSEHLRLSASDFSFLEQTRTPFPEDDELPPSAAAPANTSSSSLSTPSEARAPLRGLGETRVPSREQIIEALEHSGWVLAKAARLLGMTSRQVGYAVQKYGITRRKY